MTQQDACIRLKRGGACYFQMHEDDVRRVISHPYSMIGSDGLPHDKHPHPRLWGAFPRVLARYWREQQMFTLERAVHKMTGLSARNFRLRQRGQIRANWFADLTVFDPRRIRDIAIYENPLAQCEGVEMVLVDIRPAKRVRQRHMRSFREGLEGFVDGQILQESRFDTGYFSFGNNELQFADESHFHQIA